LPESSSGNFFINVMSALEKYFIMSIIVWRLTHFLVVEDGPLDIIIRLRKALGTNFLNKLVSCFYCSSVWIGFGAAALASAQFKEIIVLSFYYSGLAILLERMTNKTFS
jgi:hypothetical protein